MNKQLGLNRRQFIKAVGAGTATLTLGGAIGPWAHGQTPFTIGMANVLSSYFGQAEEKTLRLRAKQINDAGGLLGRTVQIVTSDSAGRPDQALRAVQDLVLSKGANVMTGFTFSEELIGALPAIGGLRRIFMGTGATTPAATIQVQSDYDTFKYFFRVGPINSLFLVQSLVIFLGGYGLQAQGWQKIAVLAEDAAWTSFITDNLGALFAANGLPIEITRTIRYAEDTTDFTSIYNDLSESGAQVIVAIMAHTGLRPSTQWAQQEVPLPLVGINVQAQDANFDELTGGNAESVVTFTAAAKAPITDKTIPYFEAFEQFKDFLPDLTIPSYNAFIASDAIDVLVDSVQRAGVVPDTPDNTDRVIEAMEQTNIVGTTGGISFYQLNEVGVSPLLPTAAFPHDVRFGEVQGIWVQWQQGSLEVLFPPNLATAGFVLPPWMR